MFAQRRRARVRFRNILCLYRQQLFAKNYDDLHSNRAASTGVWRRTHLYLGVHNVNRLSVDAYRWATDIGLMCNASLVDEMYDEGGCVV